MLPASYQLPAAIVLLLGGTVACFFGYRMFRLVLAIFGFIFGVFAASSLVGAERYDLDAGGRRDRRTGRRRHPLRRVFRRRGAVRGGDRRASSPTWRFRRAAGILISSSSRFAPSPGQWRSMYLQRYFIILGTAFGGAWTMIVGAMALIGDRAARAAVAANDVWVLYPLNPAPEPAVAADRLDRARA